MIDHRINDAVERAVLAALEDGSRPPVSSSACVCSTAADEGERSIKALLAYSTGMGWSTGPEMAGDDDDEA